jgi:DNA-binding beta-propeller fold protein YncE
MDGPSTHHTSLESATDRRDAVRPLKTLGVIRIPDGEGSDFDHAAFDPRTRRVFIAHTARDCIEVIDHDTQKHIATLPGFPGAAGAVADDGEILTTNRGGATITWLDAATYKVKAVFPSGPRPNGAAIVKRRGLGVAACIGDANQGPILQAIDLKNATQRGINLPGRPRWCVTDEAAERIFLCIREPSMVLVARLPDLDGIAHWPLPSGGAHGLDIDHARQRLYAACDDGALVEIDAGSGKVTNVWPIAGVPDVTFFNPATGLVHVAIGDPGLVETIDPRTGTGTRTMTGAGAHTTAIVVPDRLYVISPRHGGVIVLADE